MSQFTSSADKCKLTLQCHKQVFQNTIQHPQGAFIQPSRLLTPPPHRHFFPPTYHPCALTRAPSHLPPCLRRPPLYIRGMIATRPQALSDAESALLSDFLHAERPLIQTLAPHNLRLDAFLDWLESGTVQDLLTRYAAAAQLQAHLRAALASPAAMDSLLAVLNSTAAPAERRRAATALLRAAKPPRLTRNPVRQCAAASADTSPTESPPDSMAENEARAPTSIPTPPPTPPPPRPAEAAQREAAAPSCARNPRPGLPPDYLLTQSALDFPSTAPPRAGRSAMLLARCGAAP
jgi:hypothetical protein